MGISYKEAVEYLKKIDKWEDIKDQDGFTIVYAAYHYKKEKG